MANIKVGAVTSSFRISGWKNQIQAAADLGLDGVQLFNIGDELDPANLSKTGREDVKAYIASKGLDISAICGDEGLGFANPETVEKSMARAKSFLQLAVDLGTPIVTTHIGTIPDDPNHIAWKTMTAALEDLGVYAEKIGGFFATETGPEEPSLMVKFFKTLKTQSIKVNYDPANLTMSGFDAVKGVHELKDYIVHTHVKDGKRGGPEMPVGQGDVDWKGYVKALSEVGYKGYFAIEREDGDNRVEDIKNAMEFLRAL